MTTPWPPELGTLSFGLDAAEMRRRGEEELGSARRDLAALETRAGEPTLEGFLAPLDRALLRAVNVSLQGSLMFQVHPDPATRTAGRELTEAAERFFAEFRQNAKLYAGLGRLALAPEDAPTRFAISKMVREMRREGAEAAPGVRARLLELNAEIDRAGNQFMENLARMDRSIAVRGPEALAGLPPDFRAAHPAGPDGTIRLTTKYTDFMPVMAYCDDAAVRKDLLHEFMNRAYPDNDRVLATLLERRGELARMLGYPDPAAYALEDKMVATPEAVRALLNRLADRLRTPAIRDIERYFERKRRDDPRAARLEPWDADLMGRGYYDSKIRSEEFGVDARALRAYLPYGRVRDGLLDLCRDLFGITFARVDGAEVWHPTVEVYDVTRNGTPLGRCYFDFVPRDGKFSHAACFGVRQGLAGAGLPQAALICNFLDPNVRRDDARVEWSQVVTFFHEFGHLLHAMLAGQPRWLFNRASNVEWDFIEAPSQLFEEWARDPATLARFARNPDTGEGIPEDILARLRRAEAFGRASRLLRQVALSAISLEFHERPAEGMDLVATWRAAWSKYYPRALPDDYHFEASFGHLTGYSACYYTYLWSMVIARDLLSEFETRGTLTDPATAARYAEEILAPGGSRPAAELVRAFLGREFTFDAFDRWSDEPTDAGPGRGSI